MSTAARISSLLAALAFALAASTASALPCNTCQQEWEPQLPLCTQVCTTTALCSKPCYVYTTPDAAFGVTCGGFGKCSEPKPTTPAPSSGNADTACSTLPSTTTTSFAKSVNAADTFGSSFIGASYSVGASIKGKDSTISGTSGDVLEGAAWLRAWATLFWTHKKIVDITGQAKSVTGDYTSGAIDAYVLGIATWHTDWSVPLSVDKVWTKTFFEKSYPVSLAGIPVTLKGKATGEVRVSAAGGPEVDGLTFAMDPSAKIYGSATAMAGVSGFGAGITGSLTLIKASLPVGVDMVLKSGLFGPQSLGWDFTVKLVLNSLSGSLKLFVSVPIFEDPTWTLFSWSGLTSTLTLIDQVGCTKIGSSSGMATMMATY
jgi:hypothetical protein